jgi:hypothetical protein
MFIRWQNYRSVANWHRRDRPVKRCSAVLVESVRVNGKPRLKHIAFIASYEPEADWQRESLRIIIRRAFWANARDRLDRLANRITPEDRIKIEAALALHVQPTTPEEDVASDREMEEGWQRLKELATLRR